MTHSQNIPNATLSCDEGRYFDLWLFVHFLSGVTLGQIAALFETPATVTTIIVLTILIVYEIGEIITHVEEAMINRIIDIIIAFIGFWLTFEIIQLEAFMLNSVLLAGILVVYTSLAATGWRAWRKRTGR